MKNVLELHPKDIVKILDKRVIGQTHAKQVLAVSIRNQVRRYKLPKDLRNKVRLNHILLKGPTGSGKTELMRAIYAEFGIPTHFIDCTEFSEVGYHGKNVSDILPGFLKLRHSVPKWYGMQIPTPKAKAEPATSAEDAHKAGELYNHQVNVLWPLVMGWWAAGLYNRLLKDVETTGLKFNVSNLRQLLNCRISAKLRKELYRLFDKEHVDNAGVVRLWHLYTLLNQSPICRGLQRELVSEGQRYMSAVRNGMYRWNQIQIGKYHKELPADSPVWPKATLKTFLRHDNSPAANGDIDRALDIEISLAIALSGTVNWGNDRLDVWPGKPMVTKPWNLSDSIEDAFNDLRTTPVGGTAKKAKKEFLLDFGFIFFDEIDKLGARGDKDSVSRDGVQRGLLTMLSNQSVDIEGSNVDISGVGFVGAGAFAKMSEKDLMPELLGRFPMRVELQPLKYDDYLTILKSDFGAIKSFQTLMLADDIEVTVDDGAYKAMADLCEKLNAKMYLGARRLSGIADELLVKLSMDVDEHTRKIVVTRKEVESMVFEELQDKEPLDDTKLTPET